MFKKCFLILFVMHSFAFAVKTPKIDTPIIHSNSTISYSNTVNGLDVKELVISAGQSVVINSLISKFNDHIKSPFVIFIVVEGISLASDLSGTITECIGHAILQEVSRVAPAITMGASTAIAESVDDVFVHSDRSVSAYRFIKDGAVITICLVYPLFFGDSLILSSLLSGIAWNRMFHLYQDVNCTVSEISEEGDHMKIQKPNGFVAALAVSAAGLITSSFIIKYCSNLWCRIKHSAAYDMSYRYTKSITGKLFS